MRFLLIILILCSRIAMVAAEVPLQKAVPQTLMPDGKPFLVWQDQTVYTKTYHVSQNHPQASDTNPGTEALPFRTIGHAAQLVKPGERVWVHSGIYRELVRPRFSGEGADRMIAYEAAPGDKVIIRGSRIVESR